MDLTLRQLRYFRAVAECGSFTGAAELLLVAQPTISGAVKELEREVKAPLFESIGRRVRLTEAGRLLLRHCERILAELDAIEVSMSDLSGGEVGRLVVGASSTPGTYLLPQVLGRFRTELPRVEVALEMADTAEVLRRVREGLLDLGVVGEAPFEPPLSATLLCRERLVLIAAPAHPLAGQERIAVKHLAEQRFVTRESGSSTRGMVERALRAAGVPLRVTMELGNNEAVKKAVAAGLGVAFVSEKAVELERAAGVLVCRDVAGLDLTRGLYVVRRTGMHPTRLHERFIETLLRET